MENTLRAFGIEVRHGGIHVNVIRRLHSEEEAWSEADTIAFRIEKEVLNKRLTTRPQTHVTGLSIKDYEVTVFLPSGKEVELEMKAYFPGHLQTKVCAWGVKRGLKPGEVVFEALDKRFAETPAKA